MSQKYGMRGYNQHFRRLNSRVAEAAVTIMSCHVNDEASPGLPRIRECMKIVSQVSLDHLQALVNSLPA